jgi:3-dehydroquinate dehydratase-1
MKMIRLGSRQLRTPAVCGAVIGESVKAMSGVLAKAMEQGADLVELRLDGLSEQAGWEKLLHEKANVPIILTNRAKREGGRFEGGEEERVRVLLDGIDIGVDCVDVELSTEKKFLIKVVQEAKRRGVSVLMSHHDFSGTPKAEALVAVAKRMVVAGCDIAKVVTFAETPSDALAVLDFLVEVQDEVSVPVIAFAMGDAGRFTRISAPLFGSPIVYAGAGEATAPAQFDVATTKRLLRELGQVPR